MAPLSIEKPFRVAIVGAGPAGLGAAKLFSAQPNTQVYFYDQAKELREIGAGIHLQENTYRILQLIGARDGIDALESSGTSGQKPISQMLNAYTLEVVNETDNSQLARSKKPVRLPRAALQRALLQHVPSGLLELNKRLSSYTINENAVVTLYFEDGTTNEVDLLIGADGIRSVVRRITFPHHKLSYTGQMAYRTLIPFSLVKDIPDLPDATVFMFGKDSYVFSTQVGYGLFEITARAMVPNTEFSSWGQDVRKEDFLRYFEDFHPTIQAMLDVSPSNGWKQFAMHGGPRLHTIVKGPVALLGDASHPLSGAFGAGAGFALEDAYVLNLAIQRARTLGNTLSYALQLYDDVRSPHYAKLYKQLAAANGGTKTVVKQEEASFGEELRARFNHQTAAHSWIYEYDVLQAWNDALDLEDRQIPS